MALNLGAMIQAARTQQNPAGDAIANFQNQQDRRKADEQRNINNLAGILALQQAGGLNGVNLNTNAMLTDMGFSKYLPTVGG